MAEVLKICGKPITVFDEADFARILRVRLGDDAERYFNGILNGWEKEECGGECDRTYELQDHYETVIRDASDALFELANRVHVKHKDEIREQIVEIMNTLKSEL